MPLQLNNAPETARPQLVCFDPNIASECHEAVDRIADLVKQGFIVDSKQTGEVRLLPPSLPPGHSIMRILSQNGDDRLIWDRGEPSEVKDAFKKFKELLKSGYKAFSVMSNGKKGYAMDEFDALSEEILMVPSTVPG